jgi:flagellar basal body-associated protein FliL
MKIFLIVILFLLASATSIYALMPYEAKYSEESDNAEAIQLNNEKQDIIKNVMQTREEREKNLHPFVQIAAQGAENFSDDTVKTNAAIEQEEKAPYIKASAGEFKPNHGINFITILIILSGFLLSYFFIRPKSK